MGKYIKIYRFSCSAGGCVNAARCGVDELFFCSAHYQRYKKHGTHTLPDKRKTKDGKCSIVGCKNTTRSKISEHCEMHYVRFRRNSKLGASIPASSCFRCGSSLNGKKGKYCSLQCLWRNRRPTLDIKTCTQCGESYSNRGVNSPFCSTDCAYIVKNYLDQKRREIVLSPNNPFSSAQIFKRDNGICQICKTPVKFKCDRYDPLKATIDHIYPISRGGLHIVDNVQTAHYQCNVRKHAKVPA